jgi:hypothetical protein
MLLGILPKIVLDYSDAVASLKDAIIVCNAAYFWLQGDGLSIYVQRFISTRHSRRSRSRFR